jgi:hypothetical protein
MRTGSFSSSDRISRSTEIPSTPGSMMSGTIRSGRQRRHVDSAVVPFSAISVSYPCKERLSWMSPAMWRASSTMRIFFPAWE